MPTVEGDPPGDAATRLSWEQDEREAVDAIVQTLPNVQTSYVINHPSAKGIWKKLEYANRGRVLKKKISLK